MFKKLLITLCILSCSVSYGYEVGECYNILPTMTLKKSTYKVVEKYEYGVLMDKTNGMSEYFTYKMLDRYSKRDYNGYFQLEKIDCIEYDRLSLIERGK